MKRLRRKSWWGLLVAIFFIVAGCNNVVQNQPPATIPVGLLVTLSGEGVGVGDATIKGAEMAIADLQAAGGIPLEGQPGRLNLIIEDDQDQVDAVVNAVRKLIFQDNVVAIIGPQFSRNAIPAAQLAEEAEVPLISPSATNPEVTKDKVYVFRTIFIDPFQGEVMADFARQDLGATTAGILYDIASAYNRGIAEVFREQFEAAGGQVVTFESYTTGETDFTSYLTTIRDAQPDVLFLPNYAFEVPMQVQQAKSLGVTSTLLGSDSWGSILAEDRSPLQGAYFSDQFSSQTDSPKAKAFIDQFQQTYDRFPTAVAASTYDTVMLVATAIQAEGQATPEAIRRGLANVSKFEGVTGTIEFRNTGDPIRSAVIVQIQGDEFVFHKQVNP